MCSEPKEEGASKIDTSSEEEPASQAQGDEAMDEDEGEESWDMEMLVDSVRDPINRLFKMSTKIRNPSTRLRSSRAANYRQVDEETGVDLLQAMKEFDLDYVKTIFLEYRKTKARRESYPAQPSAGQPVDNDDEVWEPIKTVLTQENEREKTVANSYLIDRIAQANFRRRQQFAYWAAHRNKLDKHTKAYQAQKGRLPIAERKRGGLGLEVALGPLPSISSATRPDIARLEVSSETHSNWALSEYAPSTHQAADGPVDFPPAPKVARKTEKDNFFECPYCFFLCPKGILAEKAWKAHLIHDLRPYICTYEDCRNPTQLYDSRKDWVQHENSEHRKVWRCLEHDKTVFQSLDAYKHHLQEQHTGSILGEASLTRIIQASESVLNVGRRTCPICAVELDTGRKMDGHIALHLERFARFSLPRSIGDDEDGSNADSGMANRVDEEGSRDDDFAGAFEVHSHADSSKNQSIGRHSKFGSPSPSEGPGIPGDMLKDPPALGDDDQSSSDSGESRGEVEQPSGNTKTIDGLQLGEWCIDFQKYEKVERKLQEALEQTERRLGSDHPDTLACMDDLYWLLHGQRKFKEAEHMARRILELRERIQGRNHPEVLTWINNVGHTLYDQERYAESVEIDREVLALREKELGREHKDTLLSLANLSITLSSCGHLEEAEKLGREAMGSRKKVLGPHHADTLQSLSNLAFILRDMNQLDEAEKLGREAWETRKKVLGPSHTDTLLSLGNLVSILKALNQLEEAEKLGRETLETRRKVLGHSHVETLYSMDNLADVLERLGQLEEAERLLAEMVEIQKQELGPDHPETLTGISDLAEVLWKQDRFDEAEKLEVELLETRKQKLGSTHPDTLITMHNLAYTWHSQGRLSEASDLMEECVELQRQVLGPEHEQTISSTEPLEEWRAELERQNS